MMIEEIVARGQRLLARKESYDLTKYSYPSEAAEAQFKEALQIEPNNYDAIVGLGRCYAYTPRKYIEAVSMFERAIEIDLERPEAYFQAGKTFLNAGDSGLHPLNSNSYERALRYFEKAVHLGYKPQAWLFNALGTAYFRLQRFAESLIWFERSAQAAKEEGAWVPSTFHLAAEANENLGRFAEAIKWYELYKENGFSSHESEVNQKIKNLLILEENKKKSL